MRASRLNWWRWGPALLVATAVAALHLVALDWLRHQLPAGSLLAPLPDPVFARVLQPSPPPVVRPPSPPATPPPLLQSARPTPPPHQVPQDVAEPPEPEPEPQPEPKPEPTVAEAPAPTPAASAPSPPPELAAPRVDTWPPDTRLIYDVTGHYHGPVYGRAQVQWQRHDTGYQTRIEVSALHMTLFTLTSQGTVDEQGLRPGIYEERPPGGLRRVEFEGESIQLQDGRRRPRPPGVQDTASQLVDLSHRFSSGRDALRVGGSVQVWLARPGGVDLWTYDIVAEETVQTAEMGAVPALRLKPRPLANPRGSIVAELWFAPSLQYLPVRVRISMGLARDDETHLDMTVGRIEQAGVLSAPSASPPPSR